MTENGVSSALEAFSANWRSILETGALVHIAHGPRAGFEGNHCQIADGFIGQLGMTPIGFNWELLDASAGEGERRSGTGELVNALTHKIDNPGQPWLEPEQARACAADFLQGFDPLTLTLVSNRYDGLWNPIAGASVEWGFVAYDADTIALLLLAARS
jgi:hypothetical protein